MFKVLALCLSLCFVGVESHASVGKAMQSMPVQDAGRTKPFDTFARESLQLIYGKTSYKGRSATNVVMTWLLAPEVWTDVQLFEIRHGGLREALKLDPKRLHYAEKEIFNNERVALVFQDLRTVQTRKEKLNPYFQAVQRLESQMTMFHAIKTGQAIRLVPSSDPENDSWTAISALDESMMQEFQLVTTAFLKAVGAAAENSDKPAATEEAALKAAVESFSEKARAMNPERYPSNFKIAAEVHLNVFHPFMWSWIFYLICALFVTFYLVTEKKSYWLVGMFAVGIGFFLHTYGMALRSYLTGRPPVSNMYETVVWVPWGALVFAFILEAFHKSKILILMASIVSILCLILTDLSPTVLDPTLHPLEPVLRSTFWLTTHVLIITVSYAAFFLAFALGDLLLVYFLIDEKKYAQKIAAGAHSIYRSIQIGIVLLAAGIILGGIWADYSWGRFWGWDPKETWALIALLGYVALLHAKLVGLVRSFGLAAGSILAFALVIMAWYGVNFVLGAGLHSYGFGAGGVEYVSAFVAVHCLFVAYVWATRYSRQKAQIKKP